MAGRVAYFLIAGGALLGGMIVQGDSPITFNGEDDRRHAARASDRAVDRRADGVVDRMIDRQVDRMVTVRTKEGEEIDPSPETKRALAGAVAELVRAEGSLAMTDEDDGAAAVAAARQRRDAARQAVDRIADQAARESRTSRDELRETIRDEVREAVRS